MFARVIGLAGTVLLCATAGTATASSDLGSQGGWHYWSTPIVAAGYFSMATDCGPGEHVIGAGVSGGKFREFAPFDDQDANKTPDDGWNANVYTSGVPVSQNGYAVCTPLKPTYVKEQKSAPAETAPTVKAKCPHGTKVMSGGGAIAPANTTGAFFNSSYPFDGGDADAVNDDGWGVRLYTPSLVDLKVKVWAVCLGGITPEYMDESRTLPESNTISTIYDCPGISHMNALGAISNSDADKSFVSGLELIDSIMADMDSSPDDSGEVGITNDTPGASTHTFRTTAICLPNL